MSDCCDVFRFTDPGDGFSVGEGGQGPAGKSAYQAAVEAGFTGTEEEFNEYLSGIGDLTDEVAQQKSALDDLSALVDRKAGMLVDTASGAIASFVPDATIPNLLGVTVNVEPVQAGSGDPSPDNVRPISGWDAVEVERTGVNVFDKTLMADASTGAKYITLNLAPNTAYTMSTDDPCKSGGTLTDLFFCNMDEAVSSGTNGVKLGKTVTRTSDADGHLRIGYRCYEGWITPEQLIAFNTQVEVGTTASNYVPFSTPTTYTIALGDTVYGGTLDVTAGTLTVDRAIVAFDGTESAQNQYFPTVVVNKVVQPGSGDGYDFLNSHLPSQNSRCNYANAPKNSFQFSQVDTVWGASSADELLAIFREQYGAGTPVQICYPLATPITIDLDPVTISTISGQTNNVWADAGDVSVEFAADVKTYIDNKIAAAVAAMS